MGRAPNCTEKDQVKKGTWSPEEDKTLCDYISKYGPENWPTLPKLAGLRRCRKSCRLRWMNYLRPGLKRGPFTAEEVKTVFRLHGMLGNKWSSIAAELPGRTGNDVKNLWNSYLKRQVDISSPKGSESESISAKSEREGSQNQSSGPVVTGTDSRITNGAFDQFDDEYSSDSPWNYFLLDSPGCNDLGFLQDKHTYH